MTLFMKRLLKYGLLAEVILFVLLYYWGPNGVQVLYRLKIEKEEILQSMVVIGEKIDELEKDIKKGKTPFAKEKIARERLHMKKNNETVYFIK